MMCDPEFVISILRNNLDFLVNLPKSISVNFGYIFVVCLKQ